MSKNFVPNGLGNIGTAIKKWAEGHFGKLFADEVTAGKFKGDVEGTASGNLPLNGGALSGSVIARNVDNEQMIIRGGSAFQKGAQLNLYGKDVSLKGYESSFRLITENDADLIGRPDGTLIWNNNNLAGSAIVAQSLGENGYVKYASGLIIQWGYMWVPTTNISRSLRFHISFANTPRVIATQNNPNYVICVDSVTDDTANVRLDKTAESNVICSWFAIGY